MNNNKLLNFFFNSLLITGLIPYLNAVFTFLPNQPFNFNYSGWAWVIMFVSSIICLINTRVIKFPYIFWLPWIIFLIVYLSVSFSFEGLQLTLQYLEPVIIGIVASGFAYNFEILKKISNKFIIFVVILLLISFYYIITTGFSPNAAAISMTLVIVAALSISMYSQSKRIKYLIYFLILFIIPVTMITRMGILAFVAVFAFNFGNQGIRKKLIYALLAIPLALFVFYSDPFQDKTFRTGQGKLSDLSLNYYNNEAVNSNGRTSWYNSLEAGLEEAPYLGNGPRSDNSAFRKYGFLSGEAHNDYLAIRYNYGWIGMGLVLGALLLQFLNLYRNKRKYLKSKYLYIIWTATLTLFPALFLFMYSDNIFKYTIFFPNIFFAMIGILYGKYVQTNITPSEHTIQSG